MAAVATLRRAGVLVETGTRRLAEYSLSRGEPAGHRPRRWVSGVTDSKGRVKITATARTAGWLRTGFAGDAAYAKVESATRSVSTTRPASQVLTPRRNRRARAST